MRYRFVQFGAFFATRSLGAKVRQAIEDELQETDPAEPLILDFSGVELMSFSFADEVVGRLLEQRKAGALGPRTVSLTGLEDEETIDPVNRSLTRRELIGVCCQKDGGVRLLGAPEHLVSTLDAARFRGRFRTTELAADLGIGIGACNNRLKPLLEAGVLSRSAGTDSSGRGFVYSVATSCE